MHKLITSIEITLIEKTQQSYHSDMPSVIMDTSSTDLEKIGDGHSVQSRTSSSNHDDEVGLEHSIPHYMSMTAETDIEAYREEVNQSQNEKHLSKTQQVLTRISTRGSWIDPGPPPNGGWKAWAQVACAHLVIMCTWYVSMPLLLRLDHESTDIPQGPH